MESGALGMLSLEVLANCIAEVEGAGFSHLGQPLGFLTNGLRVHCRLVFGHRLQQSRRVVLCDLGILGGSQVRSKPIATDLTQ